MGFLKKLFSREPKPYVDDRGLYMNVECGRCKNRLRPRADKQYDLSRSDEGGYEWHKTIVCDKCYQQMPTVARFNTSYTMTGNEIEKGRYLTDEEVEALDSAENPPTEPAEPPDSAESSGSRGFG